MGISLPVTVRIDVRCVVCLAEASRCSDRANYRPAPYSFGSRPNLQTGDVTEIGRKYLYAVAADRTLISRIRSIDGARIDLLAGLLLMVEAELQAWLGHTSGNRPFRSVVAVIIAVGVAERRRFPIGVIGMIAATMVVRMSFVPTGTEKSVAGAQIGLILMFYGLGAFADPNRSRWALPAAAALFGLSNFDQPGGNLVSALATVIFATLLPYVFGRSVQARSKSERKHRAEAEELDAQRLEGPQSAAYEERLRIARELHDVVAHSISVMVIQAGGARMVMDDDPARARESLIRVEGAGREALTEMRRLIGMLSEGGTEDLRTPPVVSNVGSLVDRARAAGIDAHLIVEGTPHSISAALDLCAFRIVQEALTNVIKHACPARADVSVRWMQQALELEVVDDGAKGASPNETGAGHGIIGMRERAGMHGGTLDAAPGATGGFAVRVRFPLDDELLV